MPEKTESIARSTALSSVVLVGSLIFFNHVLNDAYLAYSIACALTATLVIVWGYVVSRNLGGVKYKNDETKK